jgi:hypothetical protein
MGAAERDDVDVDNGGMAKRSNPVQVIWDEAPWALSFLIDECGFAGPELTADGVAYHRPGLHICMEYWSWKNEHGFTTTLAQVGSDGTEVRAALGMLYAACGLGPARDVPEGAGTLYVIRKRIGQHAAALRRLVPYLDGGDADALFRRCSRAAAQ